MVESHEVGLPIASTIGDIAYQVASTWPPPSFSRSLFTSAVADPAGSKGRRALEFHLLACSRLRKSKDAKSAGDCSRESEERGAYANEDHNRYF